MDKKEIEEIIKAILARQYSWACVLMLRCHGYDPLQYIPYRTYIRLLKKNYLLEQESRDNTHSSVESINLKSTKIRFLKPEKAEKDKHGSQPLAREECQSMG